MTASVSESLEDLGIQTPACTSLLTWATDITVGGSSGQTGAPSGNPPQDNNEQASTIAQTNSAQITSTPAQTNSGQATNSVQSTASQSTAITTSAAQTGEQQNGGQNGRGGGRRGGSRFRDGRQRQGQDRFQRPQRRSHHIVRTS